MPGPARTTCDRGIGFNGSGRQQQRDCHGTYPQATERGPPRAAARIEADASPSDDPTPLAAGPTSGDGSGNLGTLLGGGALVALVAGGAGWAAWKRRGVTG